MSTQPHEAGAYEPRPGDWVTVRRYIQPTTGERTLNSEHAGRISDVQPQADGFRIWLDCDPEWIFTGYQFLGAGIDGRGPASLVTEVAPMAHDHSRILLTPDLALLLDASQCIVAEVTDPAAGGEVLRRVTVTDVDAFKAALDGLREEQRAVLAEAAEQRVRGIDDRRRSEGRLTKSEAVEWLIAKGMGRWQAVSIAENVYRGNAADGYGMRFEGGYWRIPVDTDAI